MVLKFDAGCGLGGITVPNEYVNDTVILLIFFVVIGTYTGRESCLTRTGAAVDSGGHLNNTGAKKLPILEFAQILTVINTEYQFPG